MSRHRKIQLSRSKAILVAAGALSVATAASATATTGPSGHAGLSVGHAHEASAYQASAYQASAYQDSAYQASAHDASGALQLTVTDQLAWPQAEAAYATSVSLAQRAFQLRAEQARYVVAQWTAARKQAAEQAAKKAAAASAAQSPAAAPRQTGTVTVTAASGSPQQVAEAMLGSFGWSSSAFACLDPLWAHESGWSMSAYNASSGAYGIPQALPGSRMVSAGPDWQTDAATQIRWGLEYIKGTYGSPCAAWSHEEATGWY